MWYINIEILIHIKGSSASIQSWASSLSADSQSEEAAVEFMKMFVPMLFESPSKIEQEQKATFGQMVLVSETIYFHFALKYMTFQWKSIPVTKYFKSQICSCILN